MLGEIFPLSTGRKVVEETHSFYFLFRFLPFTIEMDACTSFRYLCALDIRARSTLHDRSVMRLRKTIIYRLTISVLFVTREGKTIITSHNRAMGESLNDYQDLTDRGCLALINFFFFFLEKKQKRGASRATWKCRRFNNRYLDE